MKNREVFQSDPAATKLLNDGVAAVGEARTPKEVETLRYELEHFVCEGQYKAGIIRILESYLGGVDATVQPAAWISGFYGSGKSHLEKMLRHLWIDTKFGDGATARGLARLPAEVKDLLKELSTLGKQCGGLHAAAGTLPSGGGNSVRLTVLAIIFRSKGLPDTLPQARFCLWLEKTGIYAKVRNAVEAAGKEFLRELQDLYVSPVLAKALLTADSDFAPDEKQARATIRAQFPVVADVSTAEFIGFVREVLADGGQIPATIIVLDEVQLFIGDSTQRSTDVQEVAEALCKQLDSRVMLIGAGQTALAGSLPLLQRLRGRFTIPVELSDIDVETVTRRVVLAKKVDKVKTVQQCLDSHAGEIDRQLAGTAIAVRSEDRGIIVEDYPLLPVRRRFWEKALQAVDAPGTTAQLRTQLRIVYDAVRETAERPLGNVVPADFIFEQLQPDLLRTGVLLREIDETIRKLDDGTADGKLARRVCGLIFLIRKLPREAVADSGVRATPEMLADLLVSDLGNDGAMYRKEVPRILDKLVHDGKLIKLDDGYGLQTRESSEWDREFRNRQTKLLADVSGIGGKRSALLAAAIDRAVGGIKLVHGKSKEPRKLVLHFGDTPPATKGHEIPVWVRDGWGEAEGTVVNDARAAGADSPIVYVFVPKAIADDLKKAIVDYESAKATIDFKGAPSTAEGREARDAMGARMREAEARRDEIIDQVVDGSKVFQGGGTEMFQLNLVEKAKSAADASLDRLFPNFRDADHDRWDSVINRAKNGDEDALKAVGFTDKPEKHPVCSAILSSVGSGKKGKDVRSAFEDSPCGWPRDAVDAGLIVLHTVGHLRAIYNSNPLAVGQLDQSKVSTTEFRVESATLDVTQKIKLRKLYQTVDITCRPGDETVQAGPFLAKLIELADRSGGDAPMPARPATVHIDNLRALAGNEQLTEILKEHDALAKQVKDWGAAAELAAQRKPAWESLGKLLAHASPLPEAADLQKQADAVGDERRLLDASDPAPAIHKAVGSVLRAAINKAHSEFIAVFNREKAALEANDNWKKLTPAQQQKILADEGIDGLPTLDVGDDAALLRCLEECPLASWKTRTNALPQQFSSAGLVAAKLLEPKTQSVHLTSATLKTPEDVKAWLNKTEQLLLAKLNAGPVVIS
ncbi:MAG: BREX system P-loop protein BrxC [Planctomycetes bacterium]|nr:BREX system P-loop protein BrxC [Planctomycetota bacterium]